MDHIWHPSGYSVGQLGTTYLFLVYINDMPEGIKSIVQLFADDSLLSEAKKTRSYSRRIFADLKNASGSGRCSSMQTNVR